MTERLKPREQGDIGEAAAVWWLTSIGAVVSAPLFHSPDYDLIAQLGGRLLRVQVKTCTYRPGEHFRVMIATNGGNQSWNGVTKYFDPSRCDALFVLVADGRRWFIPSSAVEGRRSISLGGWKYSDFEVDREGTPAFPIRAPLDLERARGSAEVGESGSAVNRVPSAEGVRFPPPPSFASKHQTPTRVRSRGQTRISSQHQVTIPLGPFRFAGLNAGDVLYVEAEHDGRVVFSRHAATADASNAASDGAAPAPASPA
jgi:hypothetical protein